MFVFLPPTHKEITLRTGGVEVQGTIQDYKRIKGEYSLHYDFVTSNGSVQEGQYRVPRKFKDATPINQPVTVLYEPTNPENSILKDANNRLPLSLFLSSVGALISALGFALLLKRVS